MKPDVIINLAAENRDNIQPLRPYKEVSVDGARNVCDLARAQVVNKLSLLARCRFMVLPN